MIHLECPGCAAAFTVGDANAGKAGKCPKCGTEFAIPGGAPADADKTPARESVEVRPCPGCQARIAVTRGDLGTTVECPYCVTHFRAERTGGVLAVPPTPRDRSTYPKRPAAVSRRRDETDDDFDEDDAPPPRRRSAGGDKPSGVKTIGILLLIGGITAIVQTMGLAGVALGTVGICCGVFCFWPGFYLAVVWGVLAIVRGSGMVGGRDGGSGPPFVLLSLQVALILNLDVLNLILGVVGLVLANGNDIKDYYAGTYESSDD